MKTFAFTLAGLLLLAPCVAHAQQAPAANSQAVNDAAKARLAEGLRLYKAKRYDRAQAAFLQAYALTKSPPVLLVLGLTTLKLGKPLDALHQLEQFKRDAKDITPEQKKRADTAILEAKSQLGAIEVTAPEGTEVSIDGASAGRAPFAAAIDVLPGKHTVSSGGEQKTVDVKVQGIAKTTLGAPSRAASPPTVVEPSPFDTPSSSSPAAPSPPGFFSPPDSMAPVYVAGALGVASLTVAIILGGVGANADRNVSNAQDALARNGKSTAACGVVGVGMDPTVGQTCASLASAQKTQDDVKTPFVVSLAAGAGLSAFALGWYFFAPKAGASSEKTTPEVTPMVSPNGAGLRVRVAF